MSIWIRPLAAAAVIACLASAPTAAAAVDNLDAFVRKDAFDEIKISPNGDYFAATVPLEDRTALVILRRSDNKMTGSVNLGRNRHVADFWWVNNGRVLLSLAQKLGSLDQPQLTGDIFGADAEGGKTDILVGQQVDVSSLGSNIQSKRVERVAAFMIDTLLDDEDDVLVSVSPFTDDPYTRVERMHVDSGRRTQVARAPIRNARFVTDNGAVVRAAYGYDLDNDVRTYLRSGEGAEWKLLNSQSESGRVDVPLGFSADNSVLYLQSERPAGPDVIVGMDVASGKRTDLLSDDGSDPYSLIRSSRRVPVGVRYMDGKPRTAFFDDASPEARQYRSLEAAFPGQAAEVTSTTVDGRFSLVVVASDRNPGDFYLFDAVDKKAAHVISRRDWLDPEQMAEKRVIALEGRDGQALSGYMTIPHGSSGKSLPTVVVPHGGPYGVHETWDFDVEAQLLAAAGYAVLQVDFRGSGNHGRAFRHAGARQWGGSMQDDLTDATRWMIAQGVADPRRICIYGASYGAYAALMGVAKEPALYRCAAGYVGVYDLPMMVDESVRSGRRTGKWSKEWVGDETDALAAVSPNRIAARIKVPVFLAAGREDTVAPIAHTEKMERALKAAGVPVEALYYDTEGHGFYLEANRKAYYGRLLAFLARNLGSVPAPAQAMAPAALDVPYRAH